MALGAAFPRDTLTRHAVLLKVAEPFRARPAMFERLLAERGAIARRDLDGFEAQYVRAREHRRVVSIGAAHARRRETIEARQQELNRGEMAPVAESAVTAAPEIAHTPVDVRQAAWDAYETLKQDWSRYLAAAERTGIHVIYIRGTEGLIERIKALAGNPDLLDTSRQSLEQVLGLLDEETVLRREVENYLGAVEGKLRYRRDVLEVVADVLRITVPGLAGYGDWRKEIDPLAEAGRRIQADREAYGIHLDSIALGAERLEMALSTIHGKLGEDDEYISEERERRRQSEGAVKPDDNFTAERKAREQQSERVDHQNKADKPAETDTAPDRPDVRTLCEALERDWNQLDERADRSGVSIFDMKGSEPLIARMRSLTENPDLPDRTRQELAGILEKYQQHVAAQKQDTVTATSPTPDESAAGDAKPEATEKARAPSPAPAEPPSVPSPPDWQPAYDAFVRDWNALGKGARQSGTPLFYSRGYADLIASLERLVENTDIPTETRASMIQALENHQRRVSARIEVQDWLIDVERHMDRRDSLEDVADGLDIPVAEAPEYPDWKREAERLTAVGKDILSDTKTYGAHLANITRGETRMKWGLSDLRDAIREAAKERTKRKAPEQPVEPDRDWSYQNQLAEDARLGAGPIFDSDTGNLVPPDTMSADGTGLEGALFRLRRTFGWENWEDYERKRAVEDMQRSQDRWDKLRQDWNREVEQAKQAGIHVIYTHRYQYLRGDLESMANDTHIGRDLSPAIHDALNQLGKAEASREHIEKYRKSIARHLADRHSGWLGAKAAKQGVTVSEHEDYRIWRSAIEEAVNIAEGIIANRGADNIHFAGVASRGEGLESAISRAREVLHDDDRQISRVAKRRRQAERAVIRKDGYAHILDDPETHRKRLEEALKREHAASQKQGKGLSIGM